MRISLLFGLTIFLSAFTRCLAAEASDGDMRCSGLIGGGSTVTDINGDVTVPEGKSCTLSFVNIKGSVRSGAMQLSSYRHTRSRPPSAAMLKPETASRSCFKAMSLSEET